MIIINVNRFVVKNEYSSVCQLISFSYMRFAVYVYKKLVILIINMLDYTPKYINNLILLKAA